MTGSKVFAVGIDIGGTFTKLAVLDGQEQVLAEGRLATEAESGPGRVVARIAAATRELAAGAGLELGRAGAVGVGVSLEDMQATLGIKTAEDAPVRGT